MLAINKAKFRKSTLSRIFVPIKMLVEFQSDFLKLGSGAHDARECC